MTIHEPELPSAAPSRGKSSRERVRAYRQRMREKGYKPVTIWLPDVNSPEFRERIKNGCQKLRQSADEQDVMAFLESTWNENEANGFYGFGQSR